MQTMKAQFVFNTVSIIAENLVTLADYAEQVEVLKATLAKYVKDELGNESKDSARGRALAQAITDVLVRVHKLEKSKASRILIDFLGLRCRAERSDKGKSASKTTANGESEEVTLEGDEKTLRDDLVALALEECGDKEKAARVLRAAFLSLVSA